MRNSIILIAIAFFVIVVVWILSRRREPRLTVSETSAGADPISHSEAGEMLRAFIHAAYSQGPGAEASLQASLERLRERVDAVSEEIVRAYTNSPVAAYDLRWALLYCAGQLRQAQLLPFLQQVASSPIPPEQSKDIHLFSTVTQEAKIRVRAIEGIAWLAEAGRPEAVEALIGFMGLSTFSLRVAASQALLQLPSGEQYRARLSERLPEDQRFLLNIKPADTKDLSNLRLLAPTARVYGRKFSKPLHTRQEGQTPPATPSKPRRKKGPPQIRIS